MSTVENHAQTESLFKLNQNLLRSPYPLYDHWRKLGPIVFLKEHDIFVVTRQDLIKFINRNPTIFSNQNPLGPSSKDAAAAYLDGYQKYPKSSKGPQNLLKLGITLSELGEKDQGCTMLNGIQQQYPNASKSVIQKAKYEKKKFKCQKAG